MRDRLAQWLGRDADSRRRRLREKHRQAAVDHPILQSWLDTPQPSLATPVDQLDFLSLDFETTGLDIGRDHIISVGYTLIRGERVLMAGNGHHILRHDAALAAENVAIHRITDSQVRRGESRDAVIDQLIGLLAGRAVLAHCARIEQRFLAAACRARYGFELPITWVCTLDIAERRAARAGRPMPANALRLASLREHAGLPRYGAHNALEDAIATAELFQVQLRERGGRLRLGDVCLR